jgi:hypothetical protein
MNNQQLNNLVLDYRNNRNEETFEQIYEMVAANWCNLETVGKSIRASKAETIAAYQDVLLECIEKYDGYTNFSYLLNKSIRFRRRDIYLKKKRLSEFEVYDSFNGSDNATIVGDEHLITDYLINKNNTEDTTAATVLSKKKADQRQLIDSLLNGADETTTAIVEAFLAHPKPTATAIAKELGYHHSKVSRALSRLAAKYSTKQFGNYADYLIAL